MNTQQSLTYAKQSNTVALLKKYIPVLVFLALLVVSSLLSDAFFTSQNIFNLLRQHAGTAIVSMGMLMVILTGGIDLSVGSVAAMTGVVFAYYLNAGGLGIALLMTFLCAAVTGLAVGYLVSYQNMAPFVATLASMTAARGIAYIVSKGTPIQIKHPLVLAFGKGSFFKVPFPVIAAALVFVVVAFVLSYTSFGRFIQAIGSNETAVKLSGVRVRYYKWTVYVVIACLCAFAGIISDGRTGVGSANIANGMELDAIAACVIGGASLSGGKGSAANALMGVLILGMIGNIMNLMNVAGYPQQVIKGIIIVAAVLLQGNQKS